MTRPLQRRHQQETSPEDALRLLRGVPVGRVVFTQHALPAVRVVNHLLDAGGDILVRMHHGAALVDQIDASEDPAGVVVAYEADEIDAQTRTGWSVVVVGWAALDRSLDSDSDSGPGALPRPWVDREMSHLVRIRPDVVTGTRITL
ncbi:hypothetical protein BIV57_07805 [Mangrovactinospora gilvigrisea]|uniref:Pyridoxamine 5'-phosphate oxidase n=1 Tax=Mangrovactinospora gilvigrisea TaxID=1428644 RepID=A0A1J7BHJ9_9ACTN|nr:pyridoxamine 5'-phosphate oxidase family protein [Mangrovactinospora gilvigrisea]OIV38061.1 hypothetical protein BIV57_07805 [Mangrovactinospora gilvigrisea]